MGQEYGAGFYNQTYSQGGWNGAYRKHYSQIEYFNSWKIAIDLIKKTDINQPKILDIGCGPGQFAHMLFDHGYENYIGFDFSQQAINMAKSRLPSQGERFFCDDIFLTPLFELDIDIYTCFEVLEHINQDLEVLQRMKKGKYVIASVPNFDSRGHVRYFDKIQDVCNRYESHININHISCVSMGQGNILYMISGISI